MLSGQTDVAQPPVERGTSADGQMEGSFHEGNLVLLAKTTLCSKKRELLTK